MTEPKEPVGEIFEEAFQLELNHMKALERRCLKAMDLALKLHLLFGDSFETLVTGASETITKDKEVSLYVPVSTVSDTLINIQEKVRTLIFEDLVS